MRRIISGLRFFASISPIENAGRTQPRPAGRRGCLVSALAYAIAAIAYAASFDTGLSPEATRDLLATAESPAVPTGSWLRLRDMERSAVHDNSGAEIPPWPAIKPAASVADRRAALAALRAHGYHLVAFVRWPADSWKNGVRPDQPLRRLPIDLREAHERARQLAATYGDLIDYWEIENEPDISFVEENPETYAAFLKACYLAFKTKPETGNLKPEMDGSDSSAGSNKKTQVSGFRSQVSPSARSRVLMAAFALPPGPYFDAWVANDGLRYTDGFNYHYYGYAEDFTGVYQQFEQAVLSAPVATTAGEAVFQTRFYPFRTDWQVKQMADFSADKAATAANRALLQPRPLAVGEPALQEQGRWLVSPGTTVKETAEGWEFTVTGPAPGPLRPAMAELPLPENWLTTDGGGQTTDWARNGASLAFEYRVADATIAKREELSAKSETAVTENTVRASVIEYPLLHALGSLPAAHSRELPVFLTEYGYGLLDKDARNTPAGRDAQRAWFAAVQPQIAALKIGGPMAFILRPYLEANKNEFGLLLAQEEKPETGDLTSHGSGRATGLGPVATGIGKPEKSGGPSSRAAGSMLGRYAISPALAELFAADANPRGSRSWSVSTPPPVSVVIDFVAGAGLQMSKSHRGYAMQADKGNAQLIIYHFGAEPISGELTLEGPAWTLAGGGQTTQLTLAPGERREISLVIQSAPTDHFVAQVAIARFTAGPPLGVSTLPSVAPPRSFEAGTPPAPGPRWTYGSTFEPYLRTANGNLYQTYPRLEARESWQWYFESLANFTPAFFGRANVRAALKENQPVALVFFFRPDKYPATYVIRQAQVVEYVLKAGAK